MHGNQSTHFLFQPFDFFFYQFHRPVFGQINLVNRNTEGGGHFFGCPFLIHIQIEDLVFLRVKPAFDFCHGGIEQVLFPFLAP